MNDEFDLLQYIEASNPNKAEYDAAVFDEICKKIKNRLNEKERMENSGRETEALERQRAALIGEPGEVEYYKSQIRIIAQELGFSQMPYPSWYASLEDGVFAEILGFAGLTPWIEGRTEELRSSSSAKVIGERIYFLIDGQMVLQPQTISVNRRAQLRAALLLATPEKRAMEVYHEVYLHDGSRVTMYNEGLAKHQQDCIVLRKFFVNRYTFEEQAAHGTIPAGCIPLLRSMVQIGYNVAFIGPVRSAKTTFLTTWQSYEDDRLEGVVIESDPEIPLHIIMPKAPIMQFVPKDDRDLELVIKRIMRSDADYIIMAEARDGIALNTAVMAANKGTRRVKMTFHTSDPHDFCYDVATEIRKLYGDDLGCCITKVAKSFHYLFQFTQLQKDKSQKRLKAIWEIRYDTNQRQVSMHSICKYRIGTDDWIWSYDVGHDKEEIGEENKEALETFRKELNRLAKEFPYEGDSVFHPAFNSLILEGK